MQTYSFIYWQSVCFIASLYKFMLPCITFRHAYAPPPHACYLFCAFISRFLFVYFPIPRVISQRPIFDPPGPFLLPPPPSCQFCTCISYLTYKIGHVAAAPGPQGCPIRGARLLASRSRSARPHSMS